MSCIRRRWSGRRVRRGRRSCREERGGQVGRGCVLRGCRTVCADTMKSNLKDNEGWNFVLMLGMEDIAPVTCSCRCPTYCPLFFGSCYCCTLPCLRLFTAGRSCSACRQVEGCYLLLCDQPTRCQEEVNMEACFDPGLRPR